MQSMGRQLRVGSADLETGGQSVGCVLGCHVPGGPRGRPQRQSSGSSFVLPPGPDLTCPWESVLKPSRISRSLSTRQWPIGPTGDKWEAMLGTSAVSARRSAYRQDDGARSERAAGYQVLQNSDSGAGGPNLRGYRPSTTVHICADRLDCITNCSRCFYCLAMLNLEFCFGRALSIT